MNKDYFRDVIKNAIKLGGQHVDILCTSNQTISATSRLSKLEKLVQASITSAKIRICIDTKSAILSTDNINDLLDNQLIEKLIFSAKTSPSEQCLLYPSRDDLCTSSAMIDMCDLVDISSDTLIQRAIECENIALSNPKITNSQGSEAEYSKTDVLLINSNDFCMEYSKTRNALSISLLAQKDEFLEQDYAFTQAVYFSDLKSCSDVALEACEKTIQKIGARKIKSCKVPVIFSKDTSRSLLSDLLNAVNGAHIAKGTSFLKDKLHKQVFSKKLSIKDSAKLSKGLRSRPFDSDGLECTDNYLIKNGEISSFLLNTKYAHMLGLKSTGNSSGWDAIAPNNSFLEPGELALSDMIRSIKSGLYVTEVLGVGLNLITGDYSQGAAGFWIENGEICYPVNEITLAGNYLEMFADGNCDFASDFIHETGIDSPAIYVETMVVSGL